MTDTIARYQTEPSAIARPDDVGGYQPMRPLDVYARGIADETPRVDAIATISCGRLVPHPQRPSELYPKAARKDDPQWIYIHDPNDRAPGLTQALQAGNGRRLTIAFPFDDPRQFVQQRFTEYSKTALKAYGDERQITEIVVTSQGKDEQVRHVTHIAGSEHYDRIVARCKVSVSVYFALAEWGDDGPRVTFPDGLGMYRLRFTSRNTLRNLLASIDQVAQFTGGRIAGIPFDLAVDFREVAAPNGVKRSIPVFTFVMAPPGGITSRTFRTVTSAALSQGQALRMLPAPRSENWEVAALDGPVGDDEREITEDDVAMLERGGRCNKRHWTRAWHTLVKDTSLADTATRRTFVAEYSAGPPSLAFFLDNASESEAAALLAEAQDYLLERGEIQPEAASSVPAASSRVEPITDGNAEYLRTFGKYENEQEAALRPLPVNPPVIEAESRALPPQEPPDDDERLAALADDLDTMIRESEPVSAAETPSAPAEEPSTPEPFDYGMACELWEANRHVGYAPPIKNAKQELLLKWRDGLLAKVREAAMT